MWEWNEAVIGSSRGLRGGSWIDGEDYLRASFRDDLDPALEGTDVGFRVAGLFDEPPPPAGGVPEPSVVGLLAVGGALAWWRRRR